jgi:hypothetical protein
MNICQYCPYFLNSSRNSTHTTCNSAVAIFTPMHFVLTVVVGRATAQAVSRRPLKAEDRFRSRAVNVEFVVEKLASGHVFLRVLRFSSVNIIPPLLHIHSCITWGMDIGPVSGSSSTQTVSHHRSNKITVAVFADVTVNPRPTRGMLSSKAVCAVYAALFITDSIWTALVLFRGLRGEKMATDCPAMNITLI